ncbi:MAG: PIN domain-containing protein [Candidatus Odinarchaeota archaeon]|nr:PIN domain-containing protein [Candidatus Odinarchaeota archaeon]
MKKDLIGILALDASTLIDLLMLSNRGKVLQKALLDDLVDAYTTEFAIIETKYILCRRLGWDQANAKVERLLASGYINVIKTEEIMDLAAKYKCDRSISLADSLVLALAKKLNCKALFSHKEKELAEEMQKKKFDVEILFLEDHAT